MVSGSMPLMNGGFYCSLSRFQQPYHTHAYPAFSCHVKPVVPLVTGLLLASKDCLGLTLSSCIGLHMITKPKMAFSLIPSVYARTALPSLEDWQALWETWDVVTLEMLPSEEFLEKPINLRNACIFYLGHIPTFLDLQLTKTTKEPPTDPASYGTIFERGIDPDVDNPELCHAHSEVPEEWPPVDQILAYQRRVRSRLQKLYAEGLDNIPRHVGRAVWAGFEHELMHLETLLYMMLQSDKTLPPAHVPVPDFENLAATARSERVPNEWFDIPAQEITIGLDDPEDGTDTDLTYGWYVDACFRTVGMLLIKVRDNEKPARQAVVHAFQAQGRPMSNQEVSAVVRGSKFKC